MVLDNNRIEIRYYLLFPRVVSVFKLDKATSTTQAGWKTSPWIREASKVFIFVISIDAEVSEIQKKV